MVDSKLVQSAIGILVKKDPQAKMSLSGVVSFLEGFDAFGDLSDKELEALAKEAMSQRPRANTPPPSQATSRPAQYGRPGQSGGQGAARSRPAPDDDLLTAPYRFVAVDEHIVAAPEPAQSAAWGFPIHGGFSGAVDVEWVFETPMLIGASDANDVSGPLKMGENYIIPGASFRGMMRAAMGIVSRARLTQVNTNHRYGVRDFTHPLFNEGAGEGARRMAWNNLKAGWLRKITPQDGAAYFELTPCDRKIIRIRSMPTSFNNGQNTADGNWHKKWLGWKLDERYQAAGYIAERTNRDIILNFESRPSSFAPDNDPRPNDPTAPDWVIPSKGGRQGWYVFSSSSPSLRDVTAQLLDSQEQSPDKGNQKKREYVFMDRPGATPVRLLNDVVEEFWRIHSRPGKTKLQPEGSFKVIEPTLKKGKRIPVFYVGELEADEKGVQTLTSAEQFAMGLTRLFKIPHRRSVGDVLHRWKEHKILRGRQEDMVEALFGHVYDRVDLGIVPDESVRPGELGRKGRISFGFGTLSKSTPARPTEELTTVAMAPRASYAPFYLSGPIKDWTDQNLRGQEGEARLAGRKRYFARFPANTLAGAEEKIKGILSTRGQGGSADSRSRLKLLKAEKPGGELVFNSKVLLHNVTAEEVGAFLWTLTHGGDPNKPYRHMMGRAKNAGAGQLRIRNIKLNLQAHPGAETKAELLSTSPEQWEKQGKDGGWLAANSQSMGPFLRSFEAYMRQQTRQQDWPEKAADIAEFLGTSNPSEGARLRADFIPTPNDHGKLRRAVNASSKNDPAPVSRGHRLLETPTSALKVVYRK